jgi:hypothetical protein
MPILPLYNIRLGDAVVGRPTSTKGGAVQYDFWKVIQFLKHVSKKIEIIPGWRQHTITVTQNMANCSRRVTIIQRAVQEAVAVLPDFSHNARFSHQAEFTGADKRAQSGLAKSNRAVR